MQKHEAKFTTIFKHYLEHARHESGAWEVKHISDKEGRFDFKDLQDHQIEALRAVKHAPLFAYKIPDDGLQKPFDVFTLRRASACVVLAFEHPREYTTYIMDIDVYISMRDAIMRDTHKVSAREGTLETFAIALGVKGKGFEVVSLPKKGAKG